MNLLLLASPTDPPSTDVGRTVRRRAPAAQALVFAIYGWLALLAGLCLVPGICAAAPLPASTPFAGTALWIAQVPPLLSPQQLAAQAEQARVHTLFLKAADGSTPDPQFSASFVSGLRSAGITVCGWTFAYGANPLAEAAAAIAAVHSGAQCLVIDAEGQYDGLYGAAQTFVRALRSGLGPRFPIGLAGQAEVLQHPSFPYSVFLGPGAFNFDLPQMYWLDLHASVDAAYAATIGSNSIYGRRILPVGQIYGSPTEAEVARFRALATAYGAPGVSFFDLESAPANLLASLATAPQRLPRRSIGLPVIGAGADGDEVVWAQELLNAAGAKLPVGGFLGAQTARALARFQRRHRLHADGRLSTATWKALLHLHAQEPSWAEQPPDSARQGTVGPGKTLG